MAKPKKPAKPSTLLDLVTPEVREMQARQLLLSKAMIAIGREVEEYRRVIRHQLRKCRKAA